MGTDVPILSSSTNGNGKLLFFILNGLETNGTEPVYVNLYHRGNESFQFMIPTVTWIDDIQFQSNDDAILTRLVGEKFNSIKQLCMKASGSLALVENVETYTSGRFLQCFLPNFVIQNRATQSDLLPRMTFKNGFLEWCESAYLCRRGGIRWVFGKQTGLKDNINGTRADTMLAFILDYEVPQNAAADEPFGDLRVTTALELPDQAVNWAAFYKANSPWAEFEIPWYFWTNFIPTMTFDRETENGFWFVAQELRAEAVTWRFKRSAADDYSLHFFRGVPLVRL
jgi:hypothetical protein